MTPQPLEQGGAVTAFIPTGQEMAPRQNLIPLGRLIDFIIQRTYHELTVLAELLPRKTDMERKIEIYNFSASTRQLFIRLLALVKWANSASKVDKSAKIMAFLDKQSLLFIDTADMLSRMARETLVNARLPNFHIPAAVEILTTGTYSRLPSIIRERIVPPDPITPSEKRQTLQRLNQVIQHRLVTGNLLPQLRKFKIENGRVTFKVDHEFEVSLTVMGDGPNIPWRLLDIDILVEDKETGDGKALVHTLQVNYIHQLIQGRIVDCSDALAEVYNCLHYFSQSLQMEVLYTQTLRLMRDRLDDHIHVDEYIPGTKLTVSYWRELTNKDPKSELGYRLMIQTDQNDSAKQLAILHIPSIGNKEVDIADRAVRSDLLSMERLLVHTVYVRSLARLADLKSELQLFLQDVDYSILGTPAMLMVPILNPCLRAEQIYITVDTHTGMLRCHVPKHLDCPIMAEMQHALNNDRSRLQHLFSELRYWITQRRCEKTLQHLPATTQERLPLVFPPGHAIEKIGPHKVYIQLYRHSNVILIVELKEKDSSPNEMTYTFYLVLVKPSSVEDSQSQDAETSATTGTSSVSQSGPGSVPPGGPPSVPGLSSSSAAGHPSNSSNENDGMPKMYLKVQSLIEFDTFVATHGPGTYVDELAGSKRKLSALGEGPSKQQKVIYPAYFIPELAHVVAMCDEKLPFVALAKELTRRRIPHGGLQVEANATSLVLKLLTLPQPKAPLVPVPASAAAAGQQGGQDQKAPEPKVVSVPRIEKDVWNALLRRLLSVSVRAQVNKGNQTRLWTTELVFYGSPLSSAHHKEQGMRRAVYLQYDMSPVDAVDRIVDMILNDWSKIVYLYTLVHDFREQIDKYNLQNIVTIKSYSYTSLLLAYGPNKEVNVNIYWDIEAKEFKMVFTGGNNAINAHSMMRDQLQAHLNHNYDLAQIVHLLHETYQPLSSIAKLPIIPHLAILQSPKIPVLSFCIIPQSPTLLRISFQGVYCLEIRLRGSGLCSIRDGAYSRFDRSHVVEEFTPTQGLKGFLSKYVDETAVYRRRSQSEDDNPPSPITMEDPHGGPASVGSTFLGGGGSMRGPQSPRDPGLRFAAPLTPPSGSNPHTPASPHPQGMGGGGGSQNHPNFNMTSPPAPHMPHPSPSGGLMPSSPLNPQPSPMAHSPGPSNMPYMGGQTHTDGSPFTAAHSPAASNWPGSPGMPRPSPRPGQSPDHKAQTPHHNTSRVLPARSWAGAIPTLLTHEALDTLCRATAHPQKEIPGPELSPLERFLGSVFMRRQLQRIIHQEENLQAITSNEPGVVLFKADNLQYQVFLNPNHMQSLHMKVSQAPQMAPTMDGKPPYQWSPEDLQVLEQFFDQRVAAPPYRPAVVTSFTRMLNLSAQVMKDMIQIMRLDLMPEMGQGNKWNVQFILRMPPSATPIVPVGTTTILSHRQKILFFIQITRVPYLPNMEWKDCVTMLLPMVYDMTVNHTQLAERREQNVPQLTSAVSAHLRRFAECTVLPPGECSLFPAVRDMLMNLTLPNEQPPPGQMPNQIGPMGAMPPGGPGQIAPSPVGSSPNPMMHSPMQMGGAGGQQYAGGMAGAGPGGPGQGGAGGPN